MHQHDRRGGIGRSRAMRAIENARNLQAVVAGKARDARLDQPRLVDRRVERARQPSRLSIGQVGDENVARAGVGDDGEGDAALVIAELHPAEIALWHAGQRQRLAGGRVDDGQRGRSVGVERLHPVAAGARDIDKGDVPVRRQHRRARAAGEIIGPGLGELAMFVGRIDQAAAIGGKGVSAMIDIAAVAGGDQAGCGIRSGIDQIQVAVGRTELLLQRDSFAVGRDAGGEEATRVGEDQPPLIVRRIIGIDIERRWIAFVRADEEGRSIRAPPGEFELRGGVGRQISRSAVGVADIDMGQLIAAGVAREQDALVARKEGHGIAPVAGGFGQRHRRAATDRLGIDVEGAGRVARNQQPGAVGREGMAAAADRKAGRLEELRGGVANRRGFGACGWCRRISLRESRRGHRSQ